MRTQYCTAISLTNANVSGSPAHDQLSSAAESFERFLCWLGPDPESAGRKYESIRSRLIKMFSAKGCVFPEDLADATFERVARKLADLTNFTGDPTCYFYGVAKNIYLEYQREITTVRLRPHYSIPTDTDTQEWEQMLKQLDDALNTIPISDRELILKYYTGSGRNKIELRRTLAEQMGFPLNALRLRVFRIRKEIKNYILRSATAGHIMHTSI
jgi:DNA-directed RNA polymerase specialized sigma24 family protein